MSIFLIVREPNQEEKKQVCISNIPKTLGRSRVCDIVICDERVSKEHCQIYLLNGKAIIKDLGTKNGTILNNSAITEQQIYIGDIFSIGNTTIFLDVSKMSLDERKIHTR